MLAAVMNESDAVATTTALREAFHSLEADWLLACDLAAQAYAGRVWVALGYSEWADYVLTEVNNGAAQLPREVRVQMIAKMRMEEEMSDRAIAPVVGMSRRQVGRDAPPERPASVTGMDGKEYPTPTPKTPRRGSLVTSARETGVRLRTTCERMERISKDDRFPEHREQIVKMWQSHIEYARQVLALFDAEDES